MALNLSAITGAASTSTPLQTNANPQSTGPSMTTILVIGGLAVGGYLIYRHMKKGKNVSVGSDHEAHDDGDD